MTTGGTYYDGPSQSCGAGTWLFVWRMSFRAVSALATDYAAKLWDGSTVYDETSNGFGVNPSASIGILVSGFAVVTLGSTTTVKVSCASVRAGTVINRDPNNNSSGSNMATRMIGLRIA